jgi:hypothetical protein
MYDKKDNFFVTVGFVVSKYFPQEIRERYQLEIDSDFSFKWYVSRSTIGVLYFDKVDRSFALNNQVVVRRSNNSNNELIAGFFHDTKFKEKLSGETFIGIAERCYESGVECFKYIFGVPLNVFLFNSSKIKKPTFGFISFLGRFRKQEYLSYISRVNNLLRDFGIICKPSHGKFLVFTPLNEPYVDVEIVEYNNNYRDDFFSLVHALDFNILLDPDELK